MNRPIHIWVLFFFTCFGASLLGQSSAVQDSLRFEAFYESARLNSNSNPKTAKQYLDSTLLYIDRYLEQKANQDQYVLAKKAQTLHFLAYFVRRENKYDLSLQYLQKSLKIKEAINNKASMISTQKSIAELWLYMYNFKKAKEELDKAYDLSKELKKPKETARIYSLYGQIFRNLDDTSNAGTYHLKAVRLADSIGDDILIASIFANYAAYLRQLRRYEENLPYLLRSITIHEKANNRIALESGLSALGATYSNLGNYDKSIEYFNKAIILSQELGNEALIPYRYQGISFAYKQLGLYNEAYESYRKFHISYEKVKDHETFQKVANLDAKYEQDKIRALDSLRFEEEKIRLEAQVKQATQRKYAIWIIVLLVISIIAVTAYFFSRQRILKAKQKQLSLSLETKQKELENMVLNREVAVKEKRIDSLLTENIVHLNQKLKIAENLKEITDQGVSNVRLKSLHADLKSHSLKQTKLLNLRSDLVKKNIKFLDKLKVIHPELSKTELEICAFIHIGLSKTEIALIRGTSEGAVKTARKRIRRKIKLLPSTFLNDYLETL